MSWAEKKKQVEGKEWESTVVVRMRGEGEEHAWAPEKGEFAVGGNLILGAAKHA